MEKSTIKRIEYLIKLDFHLMDCFPLKKLPIVCLRTIINRLQTYRGKNYLKNFFVCYISKTNYKNNITNLNK